MSTGERTSPMELFGTRNGGPAHLAQDPPHAHLSWCGVRRQFRHVDRDGPVTCPKCLTQIRKGQTKAWGAR